MTLEGITSLPQKGILGVSGPDAKTFLQGQVTCHMDEVTLTQSKFGGHCNLKGRLESLFQMLLVDGPTGPLYLLIMPRENVLPAKQQLKKFALFSKVTFTDLSETMPIIGICSDETSWNTLSANQCHAETLLEGPYTVRRIIGQPERFEIVCQSPGVFEKLYDNLNKAYGEISPQEWDRYDIQAGLPAIYPQTIDKVLPHHLNMVALEGISFDKGCYLGQEIIARMHYKGKIKKHLYLASVLSNIPPAPGDSILAVDASDSSQPGLVIRSAPTINGFELLVVLDESDANHPALKWQEKPVKIERSFVENQKTS